MTTLFFILVAAVVLFIGYKFYQGYTKDKTIEVEFSEEKIVELIAFIVLRTINFLPIILVKTL